jgi:uncharacterized membrane protein
LFIALMPFVTSLLGQYAYLPLGVIFYSAAVAATGLSISAIWWYASHRHRLVDENLSQQFIQSRNRLAFIIPLFFLTSIPLAFSNPLYAMMVWWISLPASIAIRRLSGRRRTAGQAGKRS